MRYENINVGVELRKPEKGWLNPEPQPGGWYADFDQSGQYRGWDAIMNYLSENGWEVVSVVPYTWGTAKGDGKVVTYYFLFAKRPL